MACCIILHKMNSPYMVNFKNNAGYRKIVIFWNVPQNFLLLKTYFVIFRVFETKCFLIVFNKNLKNLYPTH